MIVYSIILFAHACIHKMKVTRTITAECGCETTAEFCVDCGEQLSDKKTEC